MHVIGLVLLALLLQSISPLLHARLQAIYAALTGQRIDVAAFCLPGHIAPAGSGTDASTWPVASTDCPLCQGGVPPVADLPAPVTVTAPPSPIVTQMVTPVVPDLRAIAAPGAYRSRGPPVA
jgi:hypothetical protein